MSRTAARVLDALDFTVTLTMVGVALPFFAVLSVIDRIRDKAYG